MFGRGFESHQLHKKPLFSRGFFMPFFKKLITYGVIHAHVLAYNC